MWAEVALGGAVLAAGAFWLRGRTSPEIRPEQAWKLFTAPVTPGLKLAGFTVLAELGSGGMAKVLKVRDRKGRLHALKLPQPALVADPEFLARFARENKLGSRLTHPGIVRIEEVHGEHGYPFILMEFIDGRTLQDVPNDDRQTLQMGVEALAALEAIHAAEVVHRDLTPSNLMLTRTGQLKVMDFGVAYDRTSSRITADDQVLGTPRYMAPEQVVSRDPGPAADLYALGLILYERLSGEMPFRGSVVDVIGQKMHEDVPSLALSRPDLPAAVVNVITSLVERSPERRYATAAKAREALARCLT